MHQISKLNPPPQTSPPANKQTPFGDLSDRQAARQAGRQGQHVCVVSMGRHLHVLAEVAAGTALVMDLGRGHGALGMADDEADRREHEARARLAYVPRLELQVGRLRVLVSHGNGVRRRHLAP